MLGFKVINKVAHLKSCALTRELLIVQHGFQDFFVSSGHQANSTHDLQNSHFGLDVVLAEALGDGVDAHGVGQHMGSALGVVHQGFDAADDGGMYAAL